ncbi:22K [simian adenovirus 55]|uniref:22K n=1 Tax=simian adenovirus 55 TaxID=2848082 RepID=A0A1L3INY2_9ADEN|nr:22K [Simian mastadenovirus WIV19]APG53809.1 22K [Simian mastadenovirus WIV19]
MSARSRKAEPMRLPPPEEEDWSMSEAEEDWEEMSDEEELEVGEEEGIEEAEEEPSSLPQSASPISPPTLPPKRSKAAAVTAAPKPTRRWDATSKTTGKKPARRQGYRSWRKHKNCILHCLLQCGGDVSFARRYLLFNKGVAVPRNVLHYYRHSSSSQEGE